VSDVAGLLEKLIILYKEAVRMLRCL